MTIYIHTYVYRVEEETEMGEYTSAFPCLFLSFFKLVLLSKTQPKHGGESVLSINLSIRINIATHAHVYIHTHIHIDTIYTYNDMCKCINTAIKA